MAGDEMRPRVMTHESWGWQALWWEVLSPGISLMYMWQATEVAAVLAATTNRRVHTRILEVEVDMVSYFLDEFLF